MVLLTFEHALDNLRKNTIHLRMDQRLEARHLEVETSPHPRGVVVDWG